MHHDPYGGWTVEKMAEHCALSTGYFSKRFLSVLEQSPQEFALAIKMSEAAKTLRSDASSTIKALAKATGYASVHGFTRAFSQIFGQGPATYRRNNHLL